MYIWWYLRCCVRTSVTFNNMFISWFAFWRASTTLFIFCLFTWVTYLVMEMTCSSFSFCCVSFCISEFTHCFISVVFFVVAIPASQCSAFSKKSKRLLLDLGMLEVNDLFMTSSFLSSSIAICMMDSYDWWMFSNIWKFSKEGAEHEIRCKWLVQFYQ